MTQGRRSIVGQSSGWNGYASGGHTGSYPVTIYSDTIDKFPFAADGNSTDVGNLTQARNDSAGQNSTASGYTSGGFGPPPPLGTYINTIDKFPFSSDGNATDVGDLTSGRPGPSGQQD